MMIILLTDSKQITNSYNNFYEMMFFSNLVAPRQVRSIATDDSGENRGKI